MATFRGRLVVRGKLAIEIDPHRARHVRALEGIATISAVEVPAHVGEHRVRQRSNDLGGDDRGDHGQHPASTFS